jgi:protein-S-isoprenylcysteine O-methyltransferase Ste14
MPAIGNLGQAERSTPWFGFSRQQLRYQMVWKIIIFCISTALLIYISRSSLLHPRSHGFARFIAWEAILALLILNVEHWFEKPFAWYQDISWVLLVGGIVPVVWGTLLLNKRGRPVKKRAGDPSLLAFEKTTQLVTSGIFKYIRHPMYSSLLLLAWGIFFKLPSWPGALLTVLATFFLFLTARADEAECICFFGPIYQEYMLKTRRFIPFLF